MNTIKANRPHRSRHLTWIGHCSMLDANNNAVVEYAISSSLRMPLVNDDGSLRETHRFALSGTYQLSFEMYTSVYACAKIHVRVSI